MYASPNTKLFAALAVGTLLSACGGGTDVAGGGIGGTGRTVTSVGIVSAVGSSPALTGAANVASVTINNVIYSTTASDVYVEGALTSDAVLAPGMVLRVIGTVNDGDTTGTAASVETADDFEGPIASVATITGGKQLTVLGQTVIVSSTTTVLADGLVLSDLVACTVTPCPMYEFSGLTDADGAIRASRIESKGGAGFFPDDTEVEIKGTVSNRTDSTFTIGGLTINYTVDVLDEGLLSISDGMFVEVKGTLPSADGDMDATGIELEDPLEDVSIADTETVEIEGYVSMVNGDDFRIGAHQDATVLSGAEFQNGTVANLIVGAKVEVRGVLDNGVLGASRIEFED